MKLIAPELGRLNVELRLCGMISIVWLFGTAEIAAWCWVAGLPSAQWTEDAALFAVPFVLGLGVLLALIVARLPTTRWARPGTRISVPSPWPLLLFGFPSLLVAPVLRYRDHRARARTEATGLHPDAAADNPEIERTFHRLLDLPLSAGLHFVGCFMLALVADALFLASLYEWPRSRVLGLIVLWLGLLGPLGAIVVSRSRAILRPEYLFVPRAAPPPFRRSGNLWLRLVVTGTAACLGAVLSPLLAGKLWISALANEVGAHEADELALRLSSLAASGDHEALGRALTETPHVTVHANGRTYGRPRPSLSRRAGLLDLDGDGTIDVALRRASGLEVYVPVHEDTPFSGQLFFAGALLCLATSIASIVLVASGVRSDVRRSSEQVHAVAKGLPPPRMSERSISTQEILQLTQAIERLVGRITETNVAKYVAIETAVEADRLKSQFLANMSHDLRSPLNSILGFSELLSTGIDGEITPEQREMVDTIHQSGRELLQQIDDILDTAKLEAGRMDLTPEPCPPANLITRAIAGARRRRKPSQTLEFAIMAAPGLPPVYVDPYRTVQALENLLRFAAEGLADGRVEIVMQHAKTDQGAMVAIQIHSPARLASAEELRRALRGFHRIPGHRGLGLALPIAGSILELSGGSFGIEDTGEGLVFAVRLPTTERSRPLTLREQTS